MSNHLAYFHIATHLIKSKLLKQRHGEQTLEPTGHVLQGVWLITGGVPCCRSCTRTNFPLHGMGVRTTAFILQVLFEDLKFKERPFEWVYEGLQPLELPHVLNARVGPSLTLAALWSCVAGACKLSHAIVPVPQGGLAAAVAVVCAGALLQGLHFPVARAGVPHALCWLTAAMQCRRHQA